MAEQSPGSRERLTSCRALLQGHTGALWRGGGLCSGTSDVSSKSLYFHPALWRSPGGEGDCVFPCLRARLFTGSWQPFGKGRGRSRHPGTSGRTCSGIRGHRGGPHGPWPACSVWVWGTTGCAPARCVRRRPRSVISPAPCHPPGGAALSRSQSRGRLGAPGAAASASPAALAPSSARRARAGGCSPRLDRAPT